MSTPYYTDDRVTLHHGDALEVLRGLPGASRDDGAPAGRRGGTAPLRDPRAPISPPRCRGRRG